MGGMTLPMYLIQSKKANKDHLLSHAILLSPAGIHTWERVTYYMHFIGIFFYYVVPRLVDHVALPAFMIKLF